MSPGRASRWWRTCRWRRRPLRRCAGSSTRWPTPEPQALARPSEWYRPPTMGKLEQTSAMASPTHSVTMPAIGQPQTMLAGPPVVMPYPYRAGRPDRTTWRGAVTLETIIIVSARRGKAPQAEGLERFWSLAGQHVAGQGLT